MKPACTIYWIGTQGADLKALQAQHNRSYPGNRLGMAEGWIKVAVMKGETPPKGATTARPVSKAVLAMNGTSITEVRL